jgi:gluconate 5-dehydrogenase
MTTQLAQETIGNGFSLAGRRALVTGSSRGLGLAMARGLGRAGAQVLINGRDPATLGQLAARMRDEGLDAMACPFDVADPRAADRALTLAADQHGPADILVNNVGQRDRRPLDAITPADMTRLLTIDLVPAYALSRQVAAQLMRLGKPGRIINISSILAQLGRPSDAAYITVKAGLDGLTRSLAVELGPRAITVNAVAPGAFATETNAALAGDPYWASRIGTHSALRRWGHPDEIAGIITFLASDAASYITGQTIAVDGGVTTTF